jgi:hypothetical protein
MITALKVLTVILEWEQAVWLKMAWSSAETASRTGLRTLKEFIYRRVRRPNVSFESTDPLRPQVTLIVGAREDRAYWESREIRLTKWDPYLYLFAQGVVIFAFEELLPERGRMAVASRAVTWAGSTVDIKSLAK